MSELSKTCTKCSETKILEGFGIYKRGKYGRRSWCKRCMDVYQRGQADKNPTKRAATVRKSLLKTRYGITEQDLEIMQKNQHNSCKICLTHQDDLNHKLHIDHCHTSGAVRGLLCRECNYGLGNFKDNIEALMSAISYLKG